MTEPKYDFRDGILLEKVVYKDDSCNFGYILLYLVCLLLTWIWASGWFALFFYSYIFHERIAFIVFIVIWCIFAIIVIIIGFLTIQRSKNEKIRKKEEKEIKERQLKEIKDAKKRRNENQRINNNLDEINTNIDNNHNNNNNYIDFNSERRNVLKTEENLINENNKYKY